MAASGGTATTSGGLMATSGGTTATSGGTMAATGGTSATSGGAPGGGTPGTGGSTPATGGQSTGGASDAGGTPATTGGSSAGASQGGAAGGGTTGAGGMSGGSGGGSESGCTRDSLQAATKALADALGAGDATLMALAEGATYVENLKSSSFSTGVAWQSPLTIEFQRDFLDTDTCQTFSEIIVTEGTPYVIGARLALIDGQVSDLTALVSDSDDWTFDATNYARVSSAEDWSVIPEANRDDRETLIAAGNAYFDLFNDKSVMVPWNTPCTRLEGGQFTTGNTCDVGVPDGITFADKHWVVDRAMGTAIGMVRFGGAGGLPDSHMFRCLEGKIRYVHTITICDGGC